MRTLAVLAVIALLIVAAIIHFSDRDLAITMGNAGSPSPTIQPQDASGAAAQASFAQVSGSLEHDMSGVPTSLDAPGVPPRAAFNVKSRLGALASTRREYQTLVQACDLIIYADQEHSVRQSQAQQARQNVSGDPMANARQNQLSTDAERTAIHARAQADWEVYRRQTAQEVSRLLRSLQ